jgi:hypothetical protein
MAAHAAAFHPDRHAFHKGHCTENALSHMVDTVERAVTRRKYALAVFLDIKGAFDNLTSEWIAKGMQRHGVDAEITSWFCAYLNSRFCRVKDSNKYFRLVKGTCQGGVLSPTV